MKIGEIRKMARNMGITNVIKMSKTDLIRAIQRAEGNFQCFATDPHSCGQVNCLWLKDCVDAVGKRTP